MQRRRQLQSLAAEAEGPGCPRHRLCSCLSLRCSQSVGVDILGYSPGCLQSAARGEGLGMPKAQPVLLPNSQAAPFAQQCCSREGLVLCCTGDLSPTHLIAALHANGQPSLRAHVSSWAL